MHVMHRFYLMFVEIAPISVCTSRIVALVGPSIGVPGPSSSFLKIEVTMPDTPAYESVWMCEYLVEKRKVKQCKEQMKLKKNNLNISATLPVSVFDTSTVSV